MDSFDGISGMLKGIESYDAVAGMLKWTRQMLGLSLANTEKDVVVEAPTKIDGHTIPANRATLNSMDTDTIRIKGQDLENDENNHQDNKVILETPAVEMNQLCDNDCKQDANQRSDPATGDTIQSEEDNNNEFINNTTSVDHPIQNQKHVSTREETERIKLVHRICEEISTTEAQYVEDMHNLFEVFFRPISSKACLCESTSLITLRSTCEAILELHTELMERLDPEKMALPRRISESSINAESAEHLLLHGTNAEDFTIKNLTNAFQKCIPYFKLYSTYCTSFKETSDWLQQVRAKKPEIKKFLTLIEMKARAQGLNITSLLIKPVQRICKYPLFFQQLTHLYKLYAEGNCSVSFEFKLLHETLQQIEDISRAVNEKVKQVENNARLFALHERLRGEHTDLITPTRKYLCESAVQMARLFSSSSEAPRSPQTMLGSKHRYKEGKKKTYTLVLMTDLLLLTYPDKFGYLRIKKQMPFTGIRLLSVDESDSTAVDEDKEAFPDMHNDAFLDLEFLSSCKHNSGSGNKALSLFASTRHGNENKKYRIYCKDINEKAALCSWLQHAVVNEIDLQTIDMLDGGRGSNSSTNKIDQAIKYAKRNSLWKELMIDIRRRNSSISDRSSKSKSSSR